MLFRNRQEAGQKLEKILEDFKGKNAIILALPRGGVVVGAEIARVLNLPLDIIVTRKIGAPESSELAIGAIDVDGDGVWDDEAVKNLNKEWLAKEIEKEKQEAQRRQSLYRASRGKLDLSGKMAVIVDDGIATGLTMKAAIRYARKLSAQKIIIASPIAAPEMVGELRKEVDEIRTLNMPEFFWAIGQFYENFPQVEDDEVIEIMKHKI